MGEGKQTVIEESNDSAYDDFLSNSLVVVKRKETKNMWREKKKNIPTKTSNMLNGISRTLKRKLVNVEKERHKIHLGAEYDTHLALALQVSLVQYEEGRKDRDEEIKFKEHVDKTGERRHVANKESLLCEHEATLKNKAKHSSVKKRFLNIYYTTSFKVTILFNHFWS